MNKSRLLGAVCACLLSFVTISVNAAFIGRLETAPSSGVFQAYYDNVLNITWTTNADIVGNNDTWDNQVPWAAGLNINGVTGWRLPSMDVNGDNAIVTCSSNQAACKDNEYGHLYFYGAGTTFGGGITPSSPGPFSNLQFASYWTGTEYAPNPTAAWYFLFNGIQSFAGKDGNAFAWAVRDGDVLGLTQTDPFLPNSGGGGVWNFTGVESGNWFDPPAVGGYTYTMDGGSLFTGILDFPTGFDSPFEVLVGGISQGSFSPGQQVDFGAGVASFTIQGIDPLVDPNDPSAFPLQLEFSTATADFTMSAVPVPAALWLFGSGLLGLIGISRRKKAA